MPGNGHDGKGRDGHAPGAVVAGFKLVRKVGRGAMGVVYEARQLALDRTVALKILPGHLASNADFVERFLREAKTVAKLDHPNVVRAIDAGESGGKYYFAMEFVEGQPLEHILQDRKLLPEEEALGIVMQAACGLEWAWRNGLIHRDIKPDNILITKDGVAKIADLGLAKETQSFKRASRRVRSRTSSSGPPGPEDQAPVDEGAFIMGTPTYMSPEQARAEELDIRSDIYSLGVLFYRAVTGIPPFKGEDMMATMAARLIETPKPVNEVDPEVSAETALVISTMMARERNSRYPNPSVLLYDLELVAGGKRPGFAGAKEARRKRIVEEVKSRRASAAVPGAIHVRRTRAGVKAFVAVGVLVAAAAAGAALLLSHTSSRGDGEKQSAEEMERRKKLEEEAGALYAALADAFEAKEYSDVVAKVEAAGDGYAGTSFSPKLEALRTRASAAIVEEEAAGFYAAVLKDFEAEDHAEVIRKVDEGGGRYAGTSCGPKLDSLRARADAAIKEEDRRRKEEAERRRRTEEQYRELVKLARAALSLGDYTAAFGHLNRARTLRVASGSSSEVTRPGKETEEVRSLLAKARRLQYLAGARAAEREGDLVEAARLYKLGLGIEPEKKLEDRVAEIERVIAFRGKLREAEELAAREDWQGARKAFVEALGLAREDEAKKVRPRLEAVEHEIRYDGLLEAAGAAARSRQWRKALSAAESALKLKPGAREPEELRIRALRALGPPKAIANSAGMTFVLVPAGPFLMGSDEGGPDERPRREVHLDAYYIGKHEVTNAQFEMSEPERKHRRTEFSPADNTPVVAVSWRDAVAFCRWLSEKEGIEYRLPTEAEWEKAARGTHGRKFPWGDDPPAGGEKPDTGDKWRCNVAPGGTQDDWALDGHRYASPAGAYPGGASPYGVLDLAGNVWEWCLDFYRSDYYSTGEATSPTGPAEGKQRVLRGGSFASPLSHARSSKRAAREPGFVEAFVGFRCVRALDPIFSVPGVDEPRKGDAE